jgi:hypothetical protein
MRVERLVSYLWGGRSIFHDVGREGLLVEEFVSRPTHSSTRKAVHPMSDSISRTGADTDSYVARAQARAKSVGTSQDVRSLMKGALISEAAAAADVEAPATTPVITEEMKQDTLRRIKASAKNTLIRVNPDGTRSYFHDVVNRGDGLIDTLRTDRGEGTTDSLKLLRQEGSVKVEGLLPREPTRRRADRAPDGRFVSRS